MSKLSFRARALDASKPLPVFRCEDLPDLHEYASINRAVPQMPTGMEKEEESVCINRKCQSIHAFWFYYFLLFLNDRRRPSFFFLCASFHKMAAGFSEEERDGFEPLTVVRARLQGTFGPRGAVWGHYGMILPGLVGLFVREVVFGVQRSHVT